MSKLMYVGQQTADFLADNVEEHLERYLEGSFEDLEATGDWRIPLSISADLGLLSELISDRGHEAEVDNSLIVGRALSQLTPSLARENRIWVRLSHIEGLAYSRARWLSNIAESKLAATIRTHFFASTWTGCRDDHAIARLWWNHQIASMLIPDDPAAALKLILSRADLRANFVERPTVGARLPLAQGIVRELAKNEALRASQERFRTFIKTLNAQGAGKYLETWREEEIDAFVSGCDRAA
ncbi:DUF6339 family protein [Luteimonas sp. MC1750]|uniref:DUF6339 family protein n=1 Tax=Luteimonas sp. MC1750 TaxID=2799326 RepID=UPI0018F0BC73|nr:DUF6339 family protein [Luteimonas sp. MC1750]MBJ6984335.1 hypothetical protein [Luteimonas sp. MC1750]QQO05043.1 hypothetical protein JGR68_09150 [Luteimonas sp. MC1750]